MGPGFGAENAWFGSIDDGLTTSDVGLTALTGRGGAEEASVRNLYEGKPLMRRGCWKEGDAVAMNTGSWPVPAHGLWAGTCKGVCGMRELSRMLREEERDVSPTPSLREDRARDFPKSRLPQVTGRRNVPITQLDFR